MELDPDFDYLIVPFRAKPAKTAIKFASLIDYFYYVCVVSERVV